MRNYLTAECYKVFHRKYFYLTLLAVLVLEGLLLGAYWLTLNWGNPTVDFAFAANTLGYMLAVGLYAPLLTVDMVFSEQYKNGTLKNEVAYGAPRVRIYLGKLAVSTLVSLLAAAVMVGFYMGGCWLLFPHNGGDAQAWALVGYLLAGALPLWLAGQGVVMVCYFLVRSTTVAAFVSVGILGLIPPVLQAFGLLVTPAFEMVRQFMPSVMLENLASAAAGFQWNYVGLCWAVGLAWLAGAVAVGLLAFCKKEIK